MPFSDTYETPGGIFYVSERENCFQIFCIATSVLRVINYEYGALSLPGSLEIYERSGAKTVGSSRE